MAIDRVFAELPEGALDEVEEERRSFWRDPRSLTWTDLLRSPRVVIVSPAGSGKTYECRECCRRLWSEGQAAFFIELAELAARPLAHLIHRIAGIR